MLTRKCSELGEVTEIRIAALWRQAERGEGGREVLQVMGELYAWSKG